MYPIQNLQKDILVVKDGLNTHEVYKNIKSLDQLKTFMENHVFAVWDFMSLLKALQSKLTNTSTPWLPNSNPTTARFINEIVLGEESDLNENNEPQSHFEMYLDAMEQIGANTSEIKKLIGLIEDSLPVSAALEFCDIPQSTKDFVLFSFKVIQTGKAHLIASAFTFGREDIIPEMFLEILNQAEIDDQQCSKLKYYLKRHIELDGDEHGPLSLRMIEELCQDNDIKWKEVSEVAIKAINMRLNLWDGVLNQFQIKHI